MAVTDDRRTLILDGVHQLVRPAILADGRFIAASCILTTRIAYETLKAFDVDSDPLSVSARVINAPLAAAMLQATEDGRDPQALTQDEVPDGHAVVLQRGGHVVLVAGDDLLDLSLDQADRPQYGMHLEPLWIRMPPDVSGQLRRGLPISTRLDDGTAVVYEPLWRDRWYTRSPNYGRRDRLLRRRIVGHLVRRIRERIGAT
jgi:hypothetical protein